MIALASFVCGKVSKKKGESVSLEEVKLLGGNIEHLVSEGCLERPVVAKEELAPVKEVKKKKGK